MSDPAVVCALVLSAVVGGVAALLFSARIGLLVAMTTLICSIPVIAVWQFIRERKTTSTGKE